MSDDVTDLPLRWDALLKKLEQQFSKKFKLEGILLLIGLRELGIMPREFSKEEKVDLMHIATCAILAPSGYYRLLHVDQDGWPHWEQVKDLPYIDLLGQEVFLKSHVIDYFADIYQV